MFPVSRKISFPQSLTINKEEKEEKTKKIEEEDINLYNYKNREEKQAEKKRRNITKLAT